MALDEVFELVGGGADGVTGAVADAAVAWALRAFVAFPTSASAARRTTVVIARCLHDHSGHSISR
ncbi:hypothetical protein [Terrabacter sp. NPDC080008]|uniref:hypothetical protein n=1 Tax=Terrabacter sp. NPDC080008 TaxID=3155176 RepID=UPI00344E5B9A